jgi:predicted DNA-binding transcriptional regulator AlpA
MTDHFSLSIHDLAKRYGCSVATIRRKLSKDPEFPRPLVFTDQVHRWAPSELEAYDNLLRARRADMAKEAAQ